jgi:hypothetical protein
MKIAPALLALGLTGCCCLSMPDPHELFTVDPSRLSAADAQRVSDLFEHPTLAVELEPKMVESTKELYDFLIEELPFTAACVRALDRGKYVIERAIDSAREPLTEEDRERLRRTYLVDDQAGMKLEMRRLYQDERRWVYVGRVTYEGTSFGKIQGDALTIAAATPNEGALFSQARIYVRLDSIFGILAKIAPAIFASALKRKATMFTEAAKVVSEECRRDPADFYRRMKASPHVDPNTLEKFRERFIK